MEEERKLQEERDKIKTFQTKIKQTTKNETLADLNQIRRSQIMIYQSICNW